MGRFPGNIFLIGPMGSGKTTIGRKVAERLGLRFVDCDQEIERQTGASVNLIFDIEGEAGFRRRESRMLEELASGEGLLVATGGGAVLDPRNRELIKRNGYVVWLKTSVEQQVRRLGKDRSRPLLQTPNWKQTLAELAQERDPIYRQVADLEFESRGHSILRAARALGEALLAARAEASEGAGHATC